MSNIANGGTSRGRQYRAKVIINNINIRKDKMLVKNQYFEIKIMYRNINHFLSLGYNVKCGDVITIPAEHLSKQSNKKVKVICEYCGKITHTSYQSYSNIKSRGEKFPCSIKCAYNKNIETNLKKYGVKHTMQRKDVLEKSKRTVIEKYGTDNIAKTELFKEKYKNTMTTKYNVINGFMADEIKEKSKKTMKIKYGVEYNTQREEIKRKFLYGENNPSYVHGRANFRKTCFERDRNKCVVCNSTEKLHIHHIEARNVNPDLEYVLDNCVTLCEKCHRQFHSMYGNGYNTKQQFEEFKKKK